MARNFCKFDLNSEARNWSERLEGTIAFLHAAMTMLFTGKSTLMYQVNKEELREFLND